jgi:molybdenum cofactor cytidylyltransferase
MKIDFILLAAGESKRIGHPKPLLKIGKYTFLEYILLSINKLKFKRRIIVLGAGHKKILKSQKFSSQIKIIINNKYKNGQLSSLKKGLNFIKDDSDGFIMQLVDCPLVDENVYTKIFKLAEVSKIVIPRYKKRGGHPVFFGRKYFQQLLNLDKNYGAREVVYKNRENVVYLDTDDFAVRFDVDTNEDYIKLQRITGIRC